ncbi:polyphosphate polymerase domain-containing protein [Lacipirellula parvula]|uniref:VTC domain-containing protein n=1 Tax=Lacipirellula parvula TaxID=2650471 RepID=A0A5K7XAJ7_9BACT|nr:polyphosphate polymerase domain-containing protein [Lacipirellula parvula]BBO33445.1 hypothetical protein PLANPX_3057 [Lacipirellula parvula]
MRENVALHLSNLPSDVIAEIAPTILRFDAPHATKVHVHESPSLQQRCIGDLPSRELKFIITASQAMEIQQRLSDVLTPDAHADANRDRSYSLTTLYTDTPQRDVYHRRGRHRLVKLRIRRYGVGSQVFLEHKLKRGTEVRKRRTTIDLTQLEASRGGLGLAPANAFRRQLLRQNLRPCCLLCYDRVAFNGEADGGRVRVTFDHRVQGGVMNAWRFEPLPDMRELLPEKIVCEFKFVGSLPSLLKTVIAEMQLLPTGVSKYRRCLEEFPTLLEGCGRDE